MGTVTEEFNHRCTQINTGEILKAEFICAYLWLNFLHMSLLSFLEQSDMIVVRWFEAFREPLELAQIAFPPFVENHAFCLEQFLLQIYRNG